MPEGACLPAYLLGLLHCNGSQTEDKKQAEQKRQRNDGEMPEEANVKSRFVEGMDFPGVSARTSKKGSMTQEIFCNFCKHFVGSLPRKCDLVILFLDGHASRWNTQALKHLQDHDVFAFFFASHASIWDQPNNCGLKKRVHWAIEQANKKIRRSGASTTHEHHNRIFADGWRLFLKTEADDLLETFSNNATRACWKTRACALNPCCKA
jgi:hypothetical protein